MGYFFLFLLNLFVAFCQEARSEQVLSSKKPKVLHLTFHMGCAKEIEMVAQELSLDLTTWYIHDLPPYFFDGTSQGSVLYNIGHDRAERIWKLHQDFFNSFDVILTSDTVPLARIFLQQEWKKPLVIWICNRFDYYDAASLDCHFPDKEYYDLFETACSLKNVKIIGYTAYEHVYARRKGMNTGDLVIKPTGKCIEKGATTVTGISQVKHALNVPTSEDSTMHEHVFKDALEKIDDFFSVRASMEAILLYEDSLLVEEREEESRSQNEYNGKMKKEPVIVEPFTELNEESLTIVESQREEFPSNFSESTLVEFGEKPVEKMWISAIPAEINKENTFFLPPYHNETSFMDATSFYSDLGIRNYCGRYNGAKDLQAFKAIIHLPYAWSNLALFENLYLGNPYLIPSGKFMEKLIRENNYFHSSHENEFYVSEWHSPENANYFISFDSWEDLAHKTETIDFEARRDVVKKLGQENAEEMLRRWKSVFYQWN